MGYRQYPKRDPIKNYFPLPNELFVLGLCAGEIAVYAFLMRCENRDNYICVVSYKEIGADWYNLKPPPDSAQRWRNPAEMYRLRNCLPVEVEGYGPNRCVATCVPI